MFEGANDLTEKVPTSGFFSKMALKRSEAIAGVAGSSGHFDVFGSRLSQKHHPLRFNVAAISIELVIRAPARTHASSVSNSAVEVL